MVDAAVTAQTALQKVFSFQSVTVKGAMSVGIGNGGTVDLVGFRVVLGNSSVSGSGTRRRGVGLR